MKRIVCLLLTVLLLSGCHYSESGDILAPVEFFYPRNTDSFLYGAVDGALKMMFLFLQEAFHRYCQQPFTVILWQN